MSDKNHQISAFERVDVNVFEAAQNAIISLADEVELLIRENDKIGKKTVLGLATGSTPVPFYRELIRRHKEDGLSFQNVITFNLDEYYPLASDHPESYHHFMKNQLFDHIDVLQENIYIPEGNCDREEVFAMCEKYENAIEAAGGLDIQILGIGRTGHIGFNEPGSSLESKTRMVTLDSLTRNDAAKDFHGEHNVPRHAITMGVGTIMKARKIVLLAWGRSKAEILKKTIEATPCDSIPASFLQQHGSTKFYIDEAAASELTRYRSPWLVGVPKWTQQLERRAIANLSLKLEKPLLKLVDKDYQENGLAELVTEKGPAYDLNLQIFNDVQHTITGWPGGKPMVDDSHRPERAEPAKKRVVIFSPEPVDAVMAMGATIARLVAQGHDVTVCMMTSGSLGVSEEQATRAAELIKEIEPDSSILDTEASDNRRLKSIIQRNEVKSSMKLCDLGCNNVRFLELPFYENGRYRQFHISEADTEIVQTLLQEAKPHQVFFTGATADPSSVQSKCFQVLKMAWNAIVAAGPEWVQDCWMWQYSSSSDELDVDAIDMAVPCSPDELNTKIQAIYEHRSQLQQIPRLDANSQEIWQQIRNRNQRTAEMYDRLGMAEYEAIECFQKYEFQ